MIVVADTGPINYLVQLGLTSLLSERYAKVLLPAVLKELQASQTPSSIHIWLNEMPPWLQVVPDPPVDSTLPARLGAGERAAITLVSQLKDADLLLDDLHARIEAKRRGLAHLGSLRILKDASRFGRINLAKELGKLVELGCYIDAKTFVGLLDTP